MKVVVVVRGGEGGGGGLEHENKCYEIYSSLLM